MHLEENAARTRRQHRHRARIKIKIGRRSAFQADVAISSSGLLAIGGLVSSILLSTAVVVRVARTGDNHAKGKPHELPSRS